jgi:predicted kinase
MHGNSSTLSRYASLPLALERMQEEQQKSSNTSVGLVPNAFSIPSPMYGPHTWCVICQSSYRPLFEKQLLGGHSLLCVMWHARRLNMSLEWMPLLTHWHHHMAMFREPVWASSDVRFSSQGAPPRMFFVSPKTDWHFTPYPAFSSSSSLLLIRGILGSGKSALAHTYGLTHRHIEADQYFFTMDGRLFWSNMTLTHAHAWCKAMTEKALCAGDSVVVANVFARNADMLPYIALAEAYHAPVTILTLQPRLPFSRAYVPRGISPTVIRKQYARWEDCCLEDSSSLVPITVTTVEPFAQSQEVPILPYFCQPGTCPVGGDSFGVLDTFRRKWEV